jgi:hypothetical protein
MAKKGLLLVGAGSLVVLGAILLSSRSASAAELPEADSPPLRTAEDVYRAAMAPTMTDAVQVQQWAEWLASSGQRQDYAAEVNNKATALRAELVLRAAVNPDIVATSAQLRQWSIDLQPIPTYQGVVNQRIMAQQGRGIVPAVQSITLLSGTGTLVVDFDAYLPSSLAANAASPVTVSTVPVTTKPKKKPQAAAPATTAAPQAATPATTAAPQAATPAVLQEAPAIAVAETTPEADPNGTIALARAMLAAEGSSDWREVSAAVESWQGVDGLSKPDGKFGTGSALRMAQEVGVMPLIRYWSTGGKTLAQQLQAYRVALYDRARAVNAAGNPTHAAALVSSAAREKGQGWPKTKTATAPVTFEFPSEAQLDTVESNIATILARGPSK